MAARGSKEPKSKGSKGAKRARPAWDPNWPRRGKSKLGGEIGYSIERAGEILGVSRAKAYGLVKAGEIPSMKLGSTFIVPKIPFHEKFGPLPEGGAAAA
jgi:excisionase family DNA binding protein